MAKTFEINLPDHSRVYYELTGSKELFIRHENCSQPKTHIYSSKSWNYGNLFCVTSGKQIADLFGVPQFMENIENGMRVFLEQIS